MISCFATKEIRDKFDANRFTMNKSKHVEFSKDDTAPL